MSPASHLALAASLLVATAPGAVRAAATPTQFMTTQEGRIAYDDTGGTAPLVVAIPGMGDLRGEYRFLAPRLATAGFRVVTMDVRGHGETSAVWPDYSAHAVGRDVLALIDHLGAGPAVVIGASFAAGAGLWAAHDAPAQIRGMVLISPMVTETKTTFAGRAMIAAAFAGPWRVWFWGRYWDGLFPLRTPPDQASYRARLLENLREPGRMNALHAMIALSKADTEAILGAAHPPALIIVGTADPDFDNPAADGRSLALRTGAALLLVDGAGHYPQVEATDLVAPRIVSFLRHLP